MSRVESLPEAVQAYRDRLWRREAENRIESATSAEDFIEKIGFCSAMTDCRRPGPSLYTAVCGRRDAHMPRNVQKDPESALAWEIKDEVMRRGRAYYGKLLKGRSTFIAPRLVPYFQALWGVPGELETEFLSGDGKRVLEVLRCEWELASKDLREASRIHDRVRFNRAIDELQKAFKVIPVEVVYKPTFTYIWSLVESRFNVDLKVGREEALKEIAAAYLKGAGITLRGELASVTGLRRADAGSGNWSLVEAGVAERLAPGVYRWQGLDLPYRLNAELPDASDESS